MPRLQAICLEKSGPNTFKFAIWADVPLARQPFYASTSITSAWRNATSGDIANLQNGAVTERIYKFDVSTTDTVATVEAAMAGTAAQVQLDVSNFNPWVFYGSSLSSSGVWTTTGIA